MNNNEGIVLDTTEMHSLKKEFNVEHRQCHQVACHTTDLICRFDKDRKLTYANQTFLKYLGQSEDELLGTPFSELMSQADSASLEREVQQLTVQNPTRTFVQPIKNSQGKTLWYHWACAAYFDATGMLLEVQAIGRDITSAKQAELAYMHAYRLLEKNVEKNRKQLAESESRCDLFFNRSLVGMMMVNEKTGIINKANPSSEALFGMSKDNLVGKSYRHLLLTREHEVRTIDTASNSEIFKVLCHKDKGFRYVEVTSYSTTEESEGDHLLVLNDITERVKAEQASINEKEYFNLIYDSIQDGVIALDRKNNIHLINKAASQLLHTTRDEAIGQPSANFLLLNNIIYKSPPALKTGKKENLLTWEPENEPRSILDISRHELLISGKGAVGCVLVIRDVTREKQLEKEMFLSQKLRSVGMLASGVAHEINTPVQYIGNNLWFLKKHMKEVLDLIHRGDSGFNKNHEEFLLQEIPDAIQSSIEGVDRIIKITRSLQDLTHPGQDNQQLVDVNDTISKAIHLVQKKISLDIQINTDFDENAPDIVGSASELMQVWLNLLNNAGDAVEEALDNGATESGWIKVTTKMEKHLIVVKIMDNGVGIRPEDQHMIFDLFYTTKDIGRGSGQGLVIVHDIVTNKLRGTIEMDSTTGRGTTFTIKLPV